MAGRTTHRESLHGWGRYPIISSPVRHTADLTYGSQGATLSRGLGRAYGDAGLPPRASVRPVVVTPQANRILLFDQESGLLTAEAGLSLKELLSIIAPLGWYTPVSPGTQYVTLGGMVASDIHGKNHHVDGCFGMHVRALKLRIGTGEVVTVTPQNDPELFWATCGGMGLTGHLLEVTVQLASIPSPWIYETSDRYDSLEEVFHNLREASVHWPMTVAWIDTSARGARLGRGIVMRGRWATPDEAPKHFPKAKGSITMPFALPNGLMNPKTIALANQAYFLKHPNRHVEHVTHPSSFFHVLDSVGEWNRVYGSRGFTQYQCVMPSDLAVYRELLRRFQQLGGCSFVTVFKDCGEANPGHLSFPQKGTSIALDIPINTRTPRLIRELNAMVVDHGGRVYLAKDAFTAEDTFRKMYPRLDEFQAVRARVDPKQRISSAMSQRLMGDR